MTTPGGPPPDLLVSGEERPRRRWTGGQRRAAVVSAAVAAVVAAAGAGGVLVAQDRERDERRRLAAARQDVVRLLLLEPGQDGGPRYGPRPPGVHLVVANAGPVPVRVLRGTLLPGAWQVEVPAERELRPGRSLTVELRPPTSCGTPQPRRLRLEARPPSGRPTTTEFDLSSAQLAYGGTFADAVSTAAVDCERGVPQPPEVARPSR